jgi:hypothetical protein
MQCSHCDQRIPLASMRCPSCGHDMLPEDIAQRPLVDPSLLANSAAVSSAAIAEMKMDAVTGLMVEFFRRHTGDSAKEHRAELIEAARRMQANRWRVWPILVALILYAIFSVLVLPAR